MIHVQNSVSPPSAGSPTPSLASVARYLSVSLPLHFCGSASCGHSASNLTRRCLQDKTVRSTIENSRNDRQGITRRTSQISGLRPVKPRDPKTPHIPRYMACRAPIRSPEPKNFAPMPPRALGADLNPRVQKAGARSGVSLRRSGRRGDQEGLQLVDPLAENPDTAALISRNQVRNTYTECLRQDPRTIGVQVK